MRYQPDGFIYGSWGRLDSRPTPDRRESQPLFPRHRTSPGLDSILHSQLNSLYRDNGILIVRIRTPLDEGELNATSP